MYCNTRVFLKVESGNLTILSVGMEFCKFHNVDHPCKENQLGGIFILSFFRQSTSTFFGHICSPSSGGILHIYNLYVLCFSVDCLLAGRTTDSQLKSTTRTNLLYIYHSIAPDDGLQTCPKNVDVEWRNKLRINSALGWFSLHGCIEMHSQQNTNWFRSLY